MPHRHWRWFTGALATGLLLTATPKGAQSVDASTTRMFVHAPPGLTVVATDVDVPPGRWEVESVAPAGALEQVYLAPPVGAAAMTGRRVTAARFRTAVESGRSRFMSLFTLIQNYAATHAGIGPTRFADLGGGRSGGMADQFERSPWPEDANQNVAGPFFFLVPATRVAMRTGGGPPLTRGPLVVELRPFVDDGRHWVLFNTGEVERVPIDPAFLTPHGLRVTAVRKDAIVPAPAPAATVRQTLLGLMGNAGVPAATVILRSADDAAIRLAIRWSLAGGRIDALLTREWALARERGWQALIGHGDAAILTAWMNQSRFLYGDRATRPTGPPMPPAGGRPLARASSAFDVLGGRSALRETLQTQVLRAVSAGSGAGATIPVGAIRGVDVPGLPFDRLLAGRPGGRIPLADLVPEDRLFVYFAKPSAVFPFLNEGGAFLGEAGSLSSASAYDDNLKARYLRRLGLNEASTARLLESGAIADIAVTSPDLFFLDGTHMTVLMRMRSPASFPQILSALGVGELSEAGVTEKPTPDGRSTFWIRRADLLSVSTSRREIDEIVRLAATPSSSSLGRSAELRYMLTELPLRPETRAFVYLSDPFIRRMVGPAVKIGQLRRMRTAADMTAISAGALLYRLDGHREAPTIATLADLGYVSKDTARQAYQLRPDLSVYSPQWGTLADLNPIDAAAIEMVTPDEAQDYQTYVSEYRQFWRQYFDPIGVRLDDAPGGALELSTFILPLVDSQLYNQVRWVVENKEHGSALRVPVVTPSPVFQVSLNLSDEAWTRVSGGWSQMFSQYTGIDSEIFDLIGPGLHIAVQDADPIISLGTTDLLGAFGMARSGAVGSFLTPVALSLLTRPCKILVELQDPPRVLDLLRRASRDGDRGSGWMVQFRQIAGRDAWTYTLGVPGMATVRLGLEVQNGYLVLSNIPWSQPVTVTGAAARPLNGAAMHVEPSAVRAGLAALFATQAEQDQSAALASMAALIPWLDALGGTPAEAAARHAALFGSRPVHPAGGTFLWNNGTLESTRFGTASQWKAPVYRADEEAFGLFKGATLLDLNMQFESGGLRAVCRWIWNAR